MMNITFDIQTWWRAGSAYGDGAVADATVHCDATGLPFLPGRTIKGLCRNALRLAAEAGIAVGGKPITMGDIERWFGPELEDSTGGDVDRRVAAFRYETRAGALRFDSARLPTLWLDWAKANPGALWALRVPMASTAVGNDGVAADHTLRTVEVAAPMSLTGAVEWIAAETEDARWREAFASALPVFIRGLGSTRNRGFGRVAVRVDATKGGAA
jgi:hypothetical protein